MDHQQHCYPAAPTARWERPLPLEVIPPHLWHEKLNIFICFGKKQIQIYGQSRPQTWNILPSVVAHVHHVISKDPNLCGALTSLWKQTEIWGGGGVRESPEGPPGASSFSFTSKESACRSLNYEQQVCILVSTTSWSDSLVPPRGEETEEGWS